MKKQPLLLVIAAILIAVLGLGGYVDLGSLTGSKPVSDETAKVVNTPSQTLQASIALPDEAYATLHRIKAGEDMPYTQDGSRFGNYEGLLPARDKNYYREYTVITSGIRHRGKRRIVTGGNPPEVYYYTQDHYHSFKRFEVN